MTGIISFLVQLLPLLFPIADYFWKRYANTETRKREYINFIEIMARKGNQAALNRLAAMEQVDAVNNLWKKEP